MDHLAMLTPHEQLVEVVLQKVSIVKNVLCRIYRTLCGPLKIPTSIENVWTTLRITVLKLC